MGRFYLQVLKGLRVGHKYRGKSENARSPIAVPRTKPTPLEPNRKGVGRKTKRRERGEGRLS